MEKQEKAEKIDLREIKETKEKKAKPVTQRAKAKKAETGADTKAKAGAKAKTGAKSKSKTKKILFVSGESLPFMATGGLGEVIGALPKYLIRADKNLDVRVVMPLYETIKVKFAERLEFAGHIQVALGWRSQYCGIFKTEENGVLYYFIDNEGYFKRPQYFGHFDDGERFAFFCKAVLDILDKINFIPDIIHAHDWQSGLVPVYLKTNYSHIKEFDNIKTVFTVHNIEYQGRYNFDILEDVFDISSIHRQVLELHGDINIMKGAMMCSDIISTVSPSYAKEIHDMNSAFGLDPIVNMLSGKIRGILNGIDIEFFNPETDAKISANYSAENPGDKARNKAQLQTVMNLPNEERVPVISIVSRLVFAKGVDVLADVMEELVKQQPAQFIVLGSGNRDYELRFEALSERFGNRIGVKIGYDAELARKIFAGSDMIIMPSRSEACGLTQMTASRYGAVPIVMSTGGLKDSIIPYEPEGGGNGFVFENCGFDSVTDAVNRACSVYNEPEKWTELVKRVMKWDFSWEQSAKEYIKMYKELL